MCAAEPQGCSSGVSRERLSGCAAAAPRRAVMTLDALLAPPDDAVPRRPIARRKARRVRVRLQTRTPDPKVARDGAQLGREGTQSKLRLFPQL
jgi:hypothetical protein